MAQTILIIGLGIFYVFSLVNYSLIIKSDVHGIYVHKGVCGIFNFLRWKEKG
jgi:hypothetical protein